MEQESSVTLSCHCASLNVYWRTLETVQTLSQKHHDVSTQEVHDKAVEFYARFPQIQERMTRQIAELIQKVLQPKGVAVVLEASHMCMTMRGVKKPGSSTVTVAMRGAFETDTTLQTQFYNMLRQ